MWLLLTAAHGDRTRLPKLKNQRQGEPPATPRTSLDDEPAVCEATKLEFRRAWASLMCQKIFVAAHHSVHPRIQLWKRLLQSFDRQLSVVSPGNTLEGSGSSKSFSTPLCTQMRACTPTYTRAYVHTCVRMSMPPSEKKLLVPTSQELPHTAGPEAAASRWLRLNQT